MGRKLVAYFSASGVTASIARKLAEAAGADIYEIRPETPYTQPDLDWTDKKSRSTVEMQDKSFRPAIIKGDVDLSPYTTVYLGFPIWWYVAPTVVNTFLEAYDFGGKKIILFATSGGSSFGKTLAELKPSAPDAEFKEGAILNGAAAETKLADLAAMG